MEGKRATEAAGPSSEGRPEMPQNPNEEEEEEVDEEEEEVDHHKKDVLDSAFVPAPPVSLKQQIELDKVSSVSIIISLVFLFIWVSEKALLFANHHHFESGGREPQEVEGEAIGLLGK